MQNKIKLLILSTTLLSGNLFAQKSVGKINMFCWGKYNFELSTSSIQIKNIQSDTFIWRSDVCSVSMSGGVMTRRCTGDSEVSYITNADIFNQKIKFTNKSYSGSYYDNHGSFNLIGGTIGSVLRKDANNKERPRYFGKIYFDPQSFVCDLKEPRQCQEGARTSLKQFKPVSLTFNEFDDTAILEHLDKEETITCKIGDDLL